MKKKHLWPIQSIRLPLDCHPDRLFWQISKRHLAGALEVGPGSSPEQRGVELFTPTSSPASPCTPRPAKLTGLPEWLPPWAEPRAETAGMVAEAATNAALALALALAQEEEAEAVAVAVVEALGSKMGLHRCRVDSNATLLRWERLTGWSHSYEMLRWSGSPPHVHWGGNDERGCQGRASSERDEAVRSL